MYRHREIKLDLDTTTGFHTYRLEMKDDDLLVYVDGKLALKAKGKFKPQRNYQNRIAFGASNSAELGAACWDSVKVRTANAPVIHYGMSWLA